MARIQDVGVGGYIKDPRGRKQKDSRGTCVRALKVVQNNGNSFLCMPVVGVKQGPSGPEATLDTERYQQIPIDTNVDQVTI